MDTEEETNAQVTISKEGGEELVLQGGEEIIPPSSLERLAKYSRKKGRTCLEGDAEQKGR